MAEEHYMEDDLVLPILSLPTPCPIRIDIHEDRIRLCIGQRDWEWRRGCPYVIACGTLFIPPIEDAPEEGK
jgi:hypothetical protein